MGMVLLHRTPLTADPGAYNLRVDPIAGDDNNSRIENLSDPANNAWASAVRAFWGVAGTTSQPWSSPNSSEAAQAGDEVLYEAGTYECDRGTGDGANACYGFLNSGTATTPVIMRARNKASLSTITDGQRSKLTHNQSGSANSAFIVGLGADYCVLDGFYMNEENDTSATGDGFISLGGTGNAIVNCHILGMTAANPDNYVQNHGLIASNSGGRDIDDLIANNRFERHLTNSGWADNPCILFYGTRDPIIEHNEASNVSGGFVYFKGTVDPDAVTDANEGGIIRKNYVDFATGSSASSFVGFYEANHSSVGTTTDIYQNIFKDSNWRGISTRFSDIVTGPEGIRVVNNALIWDSQTVVYGGAWFTGETLGYVFRNNITKGYPGDGDDVVFMTGDTFANWDADSYDIDRNWYHDNGTNLMGDQATSDPSYVADRIFSEHQTEGYDANGDEADPLFVDFANQDFRIQDTGNGIGAGTSPCLDAGTDFLNLLGGGTGASINVGPYITALQTDVIGIDPNYSYASYYA